MHRLWYVLHNAVAHPLMVVLPGLGGRLHDWTAARMMPARTTSGYRASHRERHAHGMTAQQWQPKLGAPGERVTGVEELEQSLRIVLRTPLRSVPGRPGFGTELDRVVDMPGAGVRPFVVREVMRAVAASEPRIQVRAVEPGPMQASGRLVVVVRWAPASGGIERVTQVEVGRAA